MTDTPIVHSILYRTTKATVALTVLASISIVTTVGVAVLLHQQQILPNRIGIWCKRHILPYLNKIGSWIGCHSTACSVGGGSTLVVSIVVWGVYEWSRGTPIITSPFLSSEEPLSSFFTRGHWHHRGERKEEPTVCAYDKWYRTHQMFLVDKAVSRETKGYTWHPLYVRYPIGMHVMSGMLVCLYSPVYLIGRILYDLLRIIPLTCYTACALFLESCKGSPLDKREYFVMTDLMQPLRTSAMDLIRSIVWGPLYMLSSLYAIFSWNGRKCVSAVERAWNGRIPFDQCKMVLDDLSSKEEMVHTVSFSPHELRRGVTPWTVAMCMGVHSWIREDMLSYKEPLSSGSKIMLPEGSTLENVVQGLWHKRHDERYSQEERKKAADTLNGLTLQGIWEVPKSSIPYRLFVPHQRDGQQVLCLDSER